MSRSLSLTYAGVVAATFFWGSNFNVGAHVVHHMPPISIAVERFALASAVLLVALGLAGKLRLATLRRNAWPLAAVGVLGVTGFNLAIFYGLRSTSPVNASLIMATTPLWTMLLAACWEGERIGVARAAGLLCGLTGVALVIGRGDLGALLHLHLARGDLLMLGGSLAWSLSTLLSRRWVHGATALETTAYSMLFGTLALLALGLALERPFAAMAAAPASAHLGIVYLSLCGAVLAYLFWFDAVHKIGATRTTSFFNLVPVSTLLVALALGTRPNLWQLIGVGAVIAGVVLASRQAPAPRAVPAPQALPCRG